MFEVNECCRDQSGEKNRVNERHRQGLKRMTGITKRQPAAQKRHAREQFHNEITHGDGRAAIFAASAQRQPRHQRNVQIPRDGILAVRAMRSGRDDAHAQRQPVDAHVQKAADNAAECEEDERPKMEWHQ